MNENENKKKPNKWEVKSKTYLLRFIDRPKNNSNCISLIMLFQLKRRIKSGF